MVRYRREREGGEGRIDTEREKEQEKFVGESGKEGEEKEKEEEMREERENR